MTLRPELSSKPPAGCFSEMNIFADKSHMESVSSLKPRPKTLKKGLFELTVWVTMWPTSSWHHTFPVCSHILFARMSSILEQWALFTFNYFCQGISLQPKEKMMVTHPIVKQSTQSEYRILRNQAGIEVNISSLLLTFTVLEGVL